MLTQAILLSVLTVGAFAASPTTITLSASPNPATFGQPVKLIATVLPSASGKVTFYDGMTVLGTSPLAAGTAVLTTPLLASGTRLLHAHYSGDSNYAAGTSPVMTETVRTVAAEGFSPGIDFPIKSPVASVAVGDFNGDGAVDMAVASGANQQLSIYLGNGDGTFQAPATYALSDNPWAVIAGDFNEDGHLDLAIVNFGGTISLLSGNGDGTFQPRVDYSSNPYPISVVMADLNGDGHADLVIVSSLGVLSVSLGNGDGTFQGPMNYAADNAASGMAVGDFNGDGKADLAIANDRGTVSIFLGNGDGTFSARTDYPAGFVNSTFVMVDDFNHDGNADVAVLGGEGLSILLGNGSGSLRGPIHYSFTQYSTAAISDFNSDGIPDFVVAGGDLVNVFLGDGDGSFQVHTNQRGPVTQQPFNSVVVSDFNGDGKADLALTTPNGITIRLGGVTQPGTLILESSLNPSIYGQSVTLTATLSSAGGTPAGSGTIVFFDGAIQIGAVPLVNGQAILTTKLFTGGSHSLTAAYGGNISLPLTQVVNADATAATLSSSINPSAVGQSVTLSAAISAANSPFPPGTIEFHDGDAVLGTRTLNQGAASFVVTALAAGPHSLTAVCKGDGNYIGSTSAIVAQTVTPRTATAVTVSASPANATLGQYVTFTASVSPGPSAGAVTFFDGVNPLGAGTFASGHVTFTTRLLPAGTRSIRAVYAGSVDYAPSTSSAIIEAISAAPANMLVQLPGAFPPGDQLASGDFNGDGKTDLVMPTVDGLAVLLGNGDGTFQPAVTYGAGTYFVNVVVGDLNADGHDDIAATGSNGLNIFLGNGDGTFQPPVNYPSGGGGALVGGDFNGDGKPDLAFNSGGVTVMLGNGDGTFQPPVFWLDDTSLSFVAVGDFHGNGTADFITCHSSTPRYPFGEDLCPYPAFAGDFNGDGKLDLVTATYQQDSAEDYGWQVTVCLGRGDGTFQPCTGLTFFDYDAPGIAVGDFNGDGNADVAVSGDIAGMMIFLGHGDGTFDAGVSYPGPSSARSLSLLAGEFNGDGRTDLVSATDAGTSILLGQLLNSAAIPPDAPTQHPPAIRDKLSANR